MRQLQAHRLFSAAAAKVGAVVGAYMFPAVARHASVTAVPETATIIIDPFWPITV